MKFVLLPAVVLLCFFFLNQCQKNRHDSGSDNPDLSGLPLDWSLEEDWPGSDFAVEDLP